MAFITLSDYKPFLIQKMKDGYTVKNSTDWNIYIKNFPFNLYPEMKDIPSNDWYDENGDEEYVPDIPVFKSFSSDVEFLYLGAKDTSVTGAIAFAQYLASNGMNKIYDNYSGIGRTNVRYVKTSDAKLYRSSTEDILVFKVNLKFNDPTTMITLAL